MNNQHRKIKGYRELDQGTIDKMNRIKQLGAQVGALVDELADDEACDQRFVAMARTSLQNGGMQLTRSVAKPDFFF